VCFCHYVEQQLQELHDDAQVMVTRLLDNQQQQQQQENNSQHADHYQQQHALANGNDYSLNNSSWQATGQPNGPAAAAAPSGRRQQQENEQLSQAAAAKLRVLAKPIGEFSTCRREWVLKLGKAAALGFMQHAAGEQYSVTLCAGQCWLHNQPQCVSSLHAAHCSSVPTS
jgi:hypothetical protein